MSISSAGTALKPAVADDDEVVKGAIKAATTRKFSKRVAPPRETSST